MTFRAIPTAYAGHLFRSRQEARWAVCLDWLDNPEAGWEAARRARFDNGRLPRPRPWLEVGQTQYEELPF